MTRKARLERITLNSGSRNKEQYNLPFSPADMYNTLSVSNIAGIVLAQEQKNVTRNPRVIGNPYVNRKSYQ